ADADADGSESWLAKITSVMTSASELSSSEVTLTSTSASDGDAFASLLYVQNWHAIIADQPYFASFGRPSPLRHLWSLAIEEQFYLLWPLAIPVVLRRLGRRRTAVLIGIGIALSAWLMSLTADIAAPERAYYGTDTRAFGILLGGLLAFGWTPERVRPTLARPARWIVDSLGVSALLALMWQFSNRSEFDPWTYPQGFLFVDLCSIVLLIAATHPASSLHRIAGTGALAALGRRSYSLYLWHWPVIVFTRPGVDWGLDGWIALAARIVLIAGLSEASYRFVEQPFRDGRVGRLVHGFTKRVGPARSRRVGIVGGAVGALAVVTLLATPSPVLQVETARAPIATTTTAPTTTAPPSTEAAAEAAEPTTTTTLAPTPTTPPTGKVSVIGESVTLGAVNQLRRYYGDRMGIDAREGRRASESIALLQKLAGEGMIAPTVILHIGNNGAISSDSFDAVYEAVGPDRTLVLVKIRVPLRWEEQVNGEIDRLASMHTNVVVADWNAIANAEPGLLTEDGVHLSAAGRERYTQVLASAAP
ncbi:MAG: acyltransferase family protein, partial [Acidimicrobiales bacterium]|nr:acyltransferase family protein [Acidimicrobiales bacterium]